MSLLGDVLGNVVLKYTADTREAERAVRGLAGEQKKAAQEVVQGLRDQQAAADEMSKRTIKAFAALGGGVAIAISGFKKYEESVRLTAATSSVDMDRLSRASNGLLTNMDAMRFAAENSRGTWKLTTSDMETVLGAARALSLQGFMPLSEAADKLGDAVRKGEIETLKDLGIAYDESLAKTDKRRAAMQALQVLSAESARTTTTETEAVQKHGATFRNSMDSIQKSIGQVVVAMEPLIRGVASLAQLAAGIVGSLASLVGLGGGGGSGSWLPAGPIRVGADLGGSDVMEVETVEAMFGLAAQKMGRDMREHELEMARRAAARRAAEFDGFVMGHRGPSSHYTPPRRRAGGGAGGYSLDAATASGMGNYTSGPGAMPQIIELVEGYLAENFPGLVGRAESGFDSAIGALGPRFQEDSAVGAFGKKSIGRTKPTILQQMFGEADEINGYTRAWGTLQTAMVGGFEAIVTGSESAGAAIKRIIGQSIMAEGSRMLIDALRESALAIAALASGNVPKAAMHGKAALMFGAGAAAAGVAANALGAGGSAAGAGAGAGAGASASGIGLGGGPREAETRNTIVLGMGWEDESARARAHRLGRAMRKVSIYDRARTSVDYS